MAARRRVPRVPGVITFVALLMFVAGGLHLVYGLGELTDSVWRLDHSNGIFAGDLWVWGIVDVVVAVILAAAAADLLRGGETGRLIAIIWIVLSMIRWLYWIPAAPLAAVVLLIIDAVILYGLTAHGEFFAPARARR
jgi:hypothetical protein